MKNIRFVGCILMAAGNAERFGENKLLADYDGKMLIERALEAIPREEFSRVLVVTQYESVRALAERFGFETLHNPRPDLGQSETIRLGTEAMQSGCDALVYMVADQPLLRRESVSRLLALSREEPEKIVSLAHNGVRGNPCLFPARFFPELLALAGDRGGSAVIRKHPEALLLCEADGNELRDVDTKATLDALRRA